MYQEEDQDQDQRCICQLCKDERDWINPESGKPYTKFNMSNISMITSKNIPKFKDSVIVLDYMKKFNEIYKCEQKFHEIFNESNKTIIMVQMECLMNFVAV